MTKIQWTSYDRKYLGAYIEFAKRQYGRLAYQASEKYLNWLYRENPSIPKNKDDLILGILGEQEVIGCVHKMRLTRKVDGKSVTIPAVHNLMVAEEHRGGLGFMLVRAAFTKENHAFVPGVVMPFSSLYQKLRCQKIETCWYRKVLTPLKGALFLSLSKVLRYHIPGRYFDHISQDVFTSSNFKITTSPDPELIQRVASALNDTSQGEISPYWSVDQFRCRFFHPLGSKTCANLPRS